LNEKSIDSFEIVENSFVRFVDQFSDPRLIVAYQRGFEEECGCSNGEGYFFLAESDPRLSKTARKSDLVEFFAGFQISAADVQDKSFALEK
jgi:hypothetical protein